MDKKQLKMILEAALLAAGKPLSLDRIQELFGRRDAPVRQDIRAALMELKADYDERGIELVEVASGFRIQVASSMAQWLEKLWEERPPRYSRALLETLSIIAYRQPATRGEIEDIRGVAVSTNIIRTLLERNWVRVVGHRDVPGKPAMFGTTKEFLDYFGLKKLDDLPPLADLQDFDKLNIQLDLADGETIEDIMRADAENVAAGADNVASIDSARAQPDTDVELLDEERLDDEQLDDELLDEEFVDGLASSNVVPLKKQ